MRGCWWRDSNPQGRMPSDVKGHRVYQFRHTSTWLAILAIPKAKTSDPTRTAASHMHDAIAVCGVNNRINAVRYSRTLALFFGYGD
jgi:hypothetical protein